MTSREGHGISDEAARSAARFARNLGARQQHTEAVADCPHCNLTFVAQWVLDMLGPEPAQPKPPGPPDPPRREASIAPTPHPAASHHALREALRALSDKWRSESTDAARRACRAARDEDSEPAHEQFYRGIETACRENADELDAALAAAEPAQER